MSAILTRIETPKAGRGVPRETIAMPARKKLLRRLATDHSQTFRRSAQAAFLVLNVWIGAQFYAFVRHFEGAGPSVSRPAGVEGWLPIAALMNLKYLIVTGHFPRMHPAAPLLLNAKPFDGQPMVVEGSSEARHRRARW